MNTTIDPLLYDAVRPVLEGGERLLWTGRPDPRRTVRARIGQSLTMAVFTLLLFLVYRSGLPVYGSHLGTDTASYALRPAVLSAGALLLLCGALLPLLSYRTAKRTVYAVTSKRVLSLTPGRLARSVWYEDMQAPLLELGSDDRGDIHFNGRFRADGTEHQPQFPRFLGIEAAESVHQLLLKQLPRTQSSSTEGVVVEDYLDLLLQRKRSLKEELSRE